MMARQEVSYSSAFVFCYLGSCFLLPQQLFSATLAVVHWCPAYTVGQKSTRFFAASAEIFCILGISSSAGFLIAPQLFSATTAAVLS